jgi:hypothetical protein
VRIFNDAFEQGHGPDSPVLLGRLRSRAVSKSQALEFGKAAIAAAYVAYNDMLARWKRVPVGGTLEVTW